MTEEQYEVVEINGLIRAICDTAWATDVRGLPTSDVYNMTVQEDGEVVKEVNEYWSSRYMSLHSAYSEMVQSYIKKDNNGTDEKITTDRPEGANR